MALMITNAPDFTPRDDDPRFAFYEALASLTGIAREVAENVEISTALLEITLCCLASAAHNGSVDASEVARCCGLIVRELRRRAEESVQTEPYGDEA